MGHDIHGLWCQQHIHRLLHQIHVYDSLRQLVTGECLGDQIDGTVIARVLHQLTPDDSDQLSQDDTLVRSIGCMLIPAHQIEEYEIFAGEVCILKVVAIHTETACILHIGRSAGDRVCQDIDDTAKNRVHRILHILSTNGCAGDWPSDPSFKAVTLEHHGMTFNIHLKMSLS